MELKGLYELHDRLEAAAVAGVNLVAEDFRLKRAIEGIAPLAEISSVIRKLYGMAVNTVSADCEDRAGSLLDTLALSQALLCTQAGFDTGAEAEELELMPRSYAPCRPYSVVYGLETALTQSGSGRYSRIVEAVKSNPQDLEDYRLQAAIVKALSDRFADIALEAERYLSAQGGNLLPLVKKGFQQDSDSGKLHRLRVIENIAEGAENDFYVSLLEHSKKELREEAIYALRFEQGNADLLLDLFNTEKGSCLEMVRQSLVYMGSETAERYLAEQFGKDPLGTAGYLRLSRSDVLSDCLAAQISLYLDQYDAAGGGLSKDWFEQFELLFLSMPGKASEAALDIYKRAAESASMTRALYLRFPGMLVKSILWSGDVRLMNLARELAVSAGKWWSAPAFAADLLTVAANKVYGEYRGRLPKDGFLGREEKKEIRKAMMSVLGRVNYNETTGRHELTERMEEYGPRGSNYRAGRPLKEPLDSRWYEFLMDSRFHGKEKAESVDVGGRCMNMTYDQILFKLLPTELREGAGAYFYKRAQEAEDNRTLYQPLIQCGWKDFRGLVSMYVKNNLSVSHSIWDVKRLLAELPLTEEERMMEIREIDQILCNCPKNSAARKHWDANESQRRVINEAAGLLGGK